MKPSAIEVWSPRLQAASGRVKVWTREIAMRRAQGAQNSEEPTNPIYLLAAWSAGWDLRTSPNLPRGLGVRHRCGV